MTHETPESTSGSRDSRPLGLRGLGALALLHLALALVYTWPLVRDWHDAIPGHASRHQARQRDSLQFLWNVWWFRRALDTAQSPFECSQMFHPQGAHLYFNPQNSLTGALAAPFVHLLGVVEAANVAIVLTLVLGGCLGSLLGWEATRSGAGALVTGLAFAPAPFVFGWFAGGLWNYAAAAPVALVAWLLLRLGRRPSLPGAVALGLALALTGTSDQSYLLFVLMLAGLMAGAAAVRRGPARDQPRRFLCGLAGGGVVACGLMAPVLLGAYREYEAGGAASVARPREPSYSAELADYLLPNPAQPLLRRWPQFRKLARQVRRPAPFRPNPGLAVLGLAALGIAWRRRRPQDPLLWWVLVGVVGLVLSLGDSVRFFGRELLPLPYSLLERLPVVGFMRVPARYCILVQLAVAVLAGYGAAGLAVRSRFAKSLVGLAVAAIVLEFWPSPIPMSSARVPAVVHRLAEAVGPGAVWQLSIGTREGLLFQTVHGRPTTGGYYSRVWARDRRPTLLLLRLLSPMLRGSSGAEALLRDVAEAWDLRFVLVSPSARQELAKTFEKLPWMRLLSREEGWHLFEILPMSPPRRADLPARLVQRLGSVARTIEPALFLGLRSLTGEGPEAPWRSTRAELEAQRDFWRRWLTAGREAPARRRRTP